LVDARGDVSLAAEYAFALYVAGCMVDLSPFIKNRIDRYSTLNLSITIKSRSMRVRGIL
jgi:hypothetical protein